MNNQPSCKIEIKVDIIEELFRQTTAHRKLYPCSTLICELKTSIETYISERLIQNKFVSLRTAMNRCLTELLTEEICSEEDKFT